MKTKILLCAGMSLFFVSQFFNVPSPAFAGEKKTLSWGAETDFNSKYLWHGLTYSAGAVVQPSLWVSLGGFDAGLWANHETGQPGLNEVDLSLSRPFSVGPVEMKAGIERYSYPAGNSTSQLFFSAEIPLSEHFKAKNNSSADIELYPGGNFADLSVEYSAVRGRASFAFSAGIGAGSEIFNKNYAGISKAALNAGFVAAECRIELGRGFYLVPHMELFRAIDPDLRASLGGPDPYSAGLRAGFEAE